MKIAVPTLFSNYLNYAPFPTQIEPSGEKTIHISKESLAFGAYDTDGSLVYWGPVSTGKKYCPDIGRGCATPKEVTIFNLKKAQNASRVNIPLEKAELPCHIVCSFMVGMHYTVPMMCQAIMTAMVVYVYLLKMQNG